MDKADGLIWSTPVYSLQVTALLKNMLDRFAYIFHRPRFFHKTCIAIVTQGVYGSKATIKYLDEVSWFWGFKVCPGLGLTVSDNPLPKEQHNNGLQIIKSAQSFYDMLTNPHDRVPTIKEILMFRMLRSIHSRSAGLIRDHEYFRDQGWFDSDYFYETKLGFIKRLIGSWADRQGVKQADKTVAERKQAKECGRLDVDEQ
jgi:multimeric flavodoxin WrbA